MATAVQRFGNGEWQFVELLEPGDAESHGACPAGGRAGGKFCISCGR